MRAGSLRHRLVIQAKTAPTGSPDAARSATGASILTWETLLEVYGSLEALSGRRLEAAQATWPQATGESMVRYRAELGAADLAKTPMRISHGGRLYPIGKVIDRDGRKRELRLIWKEGAASG
jgi:SPP1 family predicted phage head-tail adaptor